MPEHPEQGRQHEPDQPHEEELTDPGQASRGHRPERGQRREHARRDDEGGGDRFPGVGDEHHRQGHPGEGGVEHEQQGGRAGGQGLRATGQEEHEAQLRADQAKEQEPIAEDGLKQRGRAHHDEGDQRGDREPGARSSRTPASGRPTPARRRSPMRIGTPATRSQLEGSMRVLLLGPFRGPDRRPRRPRDPSRADRGAERYSRTGVNSGA